MTRGKGKDKTFLFPYIDNRHGEKEMKTEELEKLEKLEDFLNNSYAHFLTEEDEAKRAYYRGKVMGVDFALDALGYMIKDDGTKVYLLNSGKLIEHFEVVKKPRRNRERRKRGW